MVRDDEESLSEESEEKDAPSNREQRALKRSREKELNEAEGEVAALRRRNRLLEKELKEERREKKPAKSNVLDTPPSSIDEEKFKLMYPLIKIVKGSMPAYNHIDVRGDAEVFQKGGEYILTKLSERVDSYGGEDEANKEEDLRLMTLMLAALHYLSEPEKGLKVNPEPVVYEKSPDYPYSDSSEEDLSPRVNQSEPNSKKSWRMDIACSTMKRKMKGFIRENPVLSSKLDRLKWFVKLLVECKQDTIKGRDIFQTFMYAILKCRELFNWGLPIDPIYAQVWSPLRWRCGLIDIKCFVLVKNGKIDPKSLASYEEALRDRKKRRGNKEDSVWETDSAQLCELLTGTEDQLINWHGCRYRNGWYPVGTAYIDNTERDFPNLRAGSAALKKEDVKCFFQVLMRILLGNKWLKRSSSDLLQVIKQRQTLRWTKHPPGDASFMDVVLQEETESMIHSVSQAAATATDRKTGTK